MSIFGGSGVHLVCVCTSTCDMVITRLYSRPSVIRIPLVTVSIQAIRITEYSDISEVIWFQWEKE